MAKLLGPFLKFSAACYHVTKISQDFIPILFFEDRILQHLNLIVLVSPQSFVVVNAHSAFFFFDVSGVNKSPLNLFFVFNRLVLHYGFEQLAVEAHCVS